MSCTVEFTAQQHILTADHTQGKHTLQSTARSTKCIVPPGYSHSRVNNHLMQPLVNSMSNTVESTFDVILGSGFAKLVRRNPR